MCLSLRCPSSWFVASTESSRRPAGAGGGVGLGVERISAHAAGLPVAVDRVAVTSHASHPLVRRATWIDDPPGYQLVVKPSKYGRKHAASYGSRALKQALSFARPAPVKMTKDMHESLRNQLRCHAVFAPHKATWNLESFRPNVGYEQTVAASRNP